MQTTLNTVAVIGNGIMGHGIAEVFAASGTKVVLIGRSQASLAQASAKIRTSLEDFAQRGLLPNTTPDASVARIRTSTDLAEVSDAQLVIEAVPEDMALKLSIFERLDQITSPQTVLASSSGHPASELAVRVKHKERVIATHFWYPPQLLPLVEVCGAPETTQQTIDWTCARLRDAGKTPVIINQEIPGFIGNRIQFALLREAWALWASGAASAEAIDAVVRNSIGRRLAITGPIESADLGGLDTMVRFAQFLQPTLDKAPSPPEAVVTRSAQAGAHVHTRDDAAWAALLRARRDELFRWLAHDARAQRHTPARVD